jgi:hypothetical protein
MPRFYLHLRDHVSELIDPEGVELAGMEALKIAVLRAARELMSADLATGIVDLRYRIDAEDTDGRVVYSLPFKHAVSIIPE